MNDDEDEDPPNFEAMMKQAKRDKNKKSFIKTIK